MASKIARVAFRTLLVCLIIFFLFHIARPIYWKISATIRDDVQIHELVSKGPSEVEAPKLADWYKDESDSGVVESVQVSRRMLNLRVLDKQMFIVKVPLVADLSFVPRDRKAGN